MVVQCTIVLSEKRKWNEVWSMIVELIAWGEFPTHSTGGPKESLGSCQGSNKDHKEDRAPRIDAFELCCWRRLLRVPWTSRKSNPEYSLKRLMLKLKLQLWPPDVKSRLIEKTRMLRKTEGRKRRRWQMMSWLDSTTDSMNMSLRKLWEIVKDREAWRATVHGVTKSWTRLSDWTTTTLNALNVFLNTTLASYCYIWYVTFLPVSDPDVLSFQAEFFSLIQEFFGSAFLVSKYME